MGGFWHDAMVSRWFWQGVSRGFWQEAMVLCSRLQLAAPTVQGGFGMTPWCDDLVCSWRRLLAYRHSLPFPWTLSLHRRWCPSASHHPTPVQGGGGRGGSSLRAKEIKHRPG